MSLTRLRNASGRWWGNLRRHNQRNDDGDVNDECENKNNSIELPRFVELYIKQ